MNLFYLIAVLLVAIAAAMTVYPILKSQRKLAITIIVGLPLLTFSLYRFIGTQIGRASCRERVLQVV